MRLFGSDRIANAMGRFGLQEGDAIESGILNRSVESAQRKVEQHNFSIRKRTLEYDDVMNKQREVVYGFRSDVLNAENIREKIYDVFNDIIYSQCEGFLSSERNAQPRDLLEWVMSSFPISITEEEIKAFCGNPEEAVKVIYGRVEEAYELKCSMENPETVGMMERHIVLQAIDVQWQDYLRALDELRDGVRLRAYGQRDPLVEYKREASILFDELMSRIKTEICSNVFRATTSLETMQNFMMRVRSSRHIMAQHAEVTSILSARAAAAAIPQGVAAPDRALLDSFQQAVGGGQPPQQPQPAQRQTATPITREAPKVGRNDVCPCGSGKKYKKCCGVNEV